MSLTTGSMKLVDYWSLMLQFGPLHSIISHTLPGAFISRVWHARHRRHDFCRVDDTTQCFSYVSISMTASGKGAPRRIAALLDQRSAGVPVFSVPTPRLRTQILSEHRPLPIIDDTMTLCGLHDPECQAEEEVTIMVRISNLNRLDTQGSIFKILSDSTNNSIEAGAACTP